MTNLVFIEHNKIPKDYAKALKQDLKAYAVSVALKFPTASISEADKIKIARFSVRNLLKQFDLSTKNLSGLLHDEVINNLQKLYFKLKKKSSYEFLVEMVQVIRFLKRNHPRKYNKIYASIQRRLSNRQQLILSAYLNSKKKGKGGFPTYHAIGKIIKSTPGPISCEVKEMVKSIDRVFKVQKVKRAR